MIMKITLREMPLPSDASKPSIDPFPLKIIGRTQFGRYVRYEPEGIFITEEEIRHRAKFDYENLIDLNTNGEELMIVQDDEHCFGKPRIEGTGIPVEMITDRFIAGDSINELADDYNLSKFQVEEALRHQLKNVVDIDNPTERGKL